MALLKYSILRIERKESTFRHEEAGEEFQKTGMSIGVAVLKCRT
jgi:hypothetical protein